MIEDHFTSGRSTKSRATTRPSTKTHSGKDYASKRRFDITSEPESFESNAGSGPLRFVVHKHAATRLHYDLRLECQGALKSWAVPKGLSIDPRQRHLAIHVEDHPLSYSDFEGSIPKGEYGGGEVIVWDEGTYSPDDGGLWFDDRDEAERRVLEGLKNGKLSFTLRGHKLKGSWVLIETHADKKEWLVIKHKDLSADPNGDAKLDHSSVISGRTLEDVKLGKPGPGLRDARGAVLRAVPGAVASEVPSSLLPMVPTEIAKPFTDVGWTFELKLDGIRALAVIAAGQVRLVSRNGRDITEKFPLLCQELSSLPNCVLDGEIVVFEEDGRPSFQRLMQRFQSQSPRDIARSDQTTLATFCVFDLPHLEHADLRRCCLSDRRRALEELHPVGRSIRLLDTFPADGELLYKQATDLGFEGVVGKRLSSTYQDGRRSTDWVKIKGYHTEEFLVCGYSAGSGARKSSFGALILGREDNGVITFCGSVGTGFSDAQLDQLRLDLDRIAVRGPTIKGSVDVNGKPVWVEPKLWAEVRFMTWTKDGRLRFPVFMRMRPDVSAIDVLPEAPMPAPKPSHANQVLDQLGDLSDQLEIMVGDSKIRLTSLSRELWPATEHSQAVTKRDLIAYYAKVSEAYLDHLQDRPVSFVRMPDGLAGQRFFQKHWEKGLPEYVETVPVYTGSKGIARDFVLVNNLATLVWMAQMSALEIHPWYSRITRPTEGEEFGTEFGHSEASLDESALNYPDFLVVDLDPNIPAGTENEGEEPVLNRKAWDMVVGVALGLREMLDAIRMRSYLKTSGKTGLHIYLPLRREYRYEEVRTVAETLGRHLQMQFPEQVTMEWTVKKRPQKVFFDHNQNVRGKTLCCCLSTRAVPGACVSMPIGWDELEAIYPRDFNAFTVPGILAAHGDPWKDILTDRQSLPA